MFVIVANCLHLVRFLLVFLSFFVILYWILQLANASFLAPVAPFFESIKALTHIFYNRTSVVTGTPIDFSFLMATFILLLSAWGIKLLADSIVELEVKFDSAHDLIKTKHEEMFNKKLEKEHRINESKNSKLILLVKFKASSFKKDTMFDRNINDGVSDKENEILFDFLEFIEEEFECEKEIFEKGVLISFSDFNNANKVITKLQNGISALRKKLADDHWKVDYTVAVDVMAKDNEKHTKTRKMAGLLKLGMDNEILCFATFKERYLISNNQEYLLQEKGFYQILGDNKEVFCIKSSK